jgi:hypothetical protein
VGKKTNGKPVGFYKVYKDGKLVEMGDAKNFVKQPNVELYDYLLERSANSEDFLIGMNQKNTSLMYRNFESNHFVILEDAKWKMLKLGQDMFDFDTMFLFHGAQPNYLSFYGNISRKMEKNVLKIQCSDGINYDRFGRLNFVGYSEYDIDNKNSQLDGYFRDFYHRDGGGLKGVGTQENGERPVLRKVYHENGKLAHIAIENNGSEEVAHGAGASDFYISGDFCAVYDNKGMFKFLGGIGNGTLKGKGSVLWDNNWCRVKKGFQRNIDLPLWTLYPNEN